MNRNKPLSRRDPSARGSIQASSRPLFGSGIALAALLSLTVGAAFADTPTMSGAARAAGHKHHRVHHSSASQSPKLVSIHISGSAATHPYAPQPGANGMFAANASTSTPNESPNVFSTLPDSATPIMNRIATMLSAARTRLNSSQPSGAVEQYRGASSALRLALATGDLKDTAPGVKGLPISSWQITDDIRTLRALAKNASGQQAAALNQIAALYATGARDFFTGELRRALLADNSTLTADVRSTQSQRSGTASSSERLPPSAFIHENGAPGGIIQSDGSLAPISSEGSIFTPVNAPYAATGVLPNIAPPLGPYGGEPFIWPDNQVIVPQVPVVPVVPAGPAVPTIPVSP